MIADRKLFWMYRAEAPSVTVTQDVVFLLFFSFFSQGFRHVGTNVAQAHLP